MRNQQAGSREKKNPVDKGVLLRLVERAASTERGGAVATLGAKHPDIGGAGVNVELNHLRGCPHGHVDKVESAANVGGIC